MAFRRTELGVEVANDPARARAKILDALRANEGFLNRAAVALGVTHFTLARWITTLDLGADVKRVVADAKAAGRYDPRGKGATGRPRSVK